MASAEMVELWRGGILESTHRGHAVICDEAGEIVEAWGDPEAVHGLCTDGLFASDVAASVACPGGLAEITDAAGLGITP